MGTKRRRFTAEFKAKVVIVMEAPRGDRKPLMIWMIGTPGPMLGPHAIRKEVVPLLVESPALRAAMDGRWEGARDLTNRLRFSSI